MPLPIPHAFPIQTNGEVANWNSPSGTEDDQPGYYYDVAVNQLRAHHVVWTTSAGKLRSDWWDVVETYLENSGSTLPTNL